VTRKTTTSVLVLIHILEVVASSRRSSVITRENRYTRLDLSPDVSVRKDLARNLIVRKNHADLKGVVEVLVTMERAFVLLEFKVIIVRR